MSMPPHSSSSGPVAHALSFLDESWCHMPWRGTGICQPWQVGGLASGLCAEHSDGPQREGIFCKAESTSTVQELQQTLDHSLLVDMASQLALLLVIIHNVSPPDLPLQKLLPELPCYKSPQKPLAMQDFLRPCRTS